MKCSAALEARKARRVKRTTTCPLVERPAESASTAEGPSQRVCCRTRRGLCSLSGCTFRQAAAIGGLVAQRP